MAKFALVFLLFLFSCGAYAECKNTSLEGKINHEVKRLKNGDKYAQEYPTGRQYFSVSADGGKLNGCIVYYAIEGWNNSNAVSEYMSFIYLNSGKTELKDTIEMGRSPWGEYRHIHFEIPPKVENDILNIAIRLYAKGDGSCCPSISSVALFKFIKNHLVEIKH